jgi:SAM-dependent methyltransferase
MHDRDQIVQIYCNENYEKHPYFSYDEQHIENLSKRRFRNYNYALTHVESVIGTGKLLDVGCGAGAFLSIARRRGWDAQGVEISPGLCRICEQKNFYVINCSFEEANLPDNYYELVTFWDIIEHVIDPVFCIKKARALLASDGIAIFCTPNEHSLLARIGSALYKSTCSYYSYPAFALHPYNHTYFFSKISFIKLIEKCDMKVIGCYSQEAFFEHSPLAGRVQKLAVALIEKIARLFDSRYELVVLAKL